MGCHKAETDKTNTEVTALNLIHHYLCIVLVLLLLALTNTKAELYWTKMTYTIYVAPVGEKIMT